MSDLTTPAVARVRLCQRRGRHAEAVAGESNGLGFVLRALAAAPNASLQLVVLPSGDLSRDVADRADGQTVELIGRTLLAIARALVAVPFHLLYTGRPEPSSTAPRAAPRPVNPEPTFRAELRLRVSAPTRAAARLHADAVAAAFCGFAGGSRWRSRRVWRFGQFDRAHARYRPSTAADAVLLPNEAANLFHLDALALGTGAPLSQSAPQQGSLGPGKVICQLDGPRRMPVTISPSDARHHMHVLGPTGAGKTTLIQNLTLADIGGGRGVAIFDPKGDLVRSLMERIPRSAWDRVVLISPAEQDRPVGLNVLACDDADQRDLVADQIVAIFKKLYAQSWGARTDDVFRAAVLTLLHRPGSTICELPMLLLHPERFGDLIARLDDPAGLGLFWQDYLARSEAERLAWSGPVLNKLRAVLMRPKIRNILGQSESTIDLADCMDTGRIVLVSLEKGSLGEETSHLMGAFLVARFWQAAMGRADRPEAERPDFVLYLDEFQNYLHLPNSFDEVLAEARGYHLGLVLANQHLGQLTTATRQAVSANARTRVVFQCGPDDARALAREFAPLGDADLRNLHRFEVAVRL